jgi:hypothetical protein
VQLIDQANINAQIVQESRQSQRGRGGNMPAQRRCGRCHEVGHYVTKCPQRALDQIEARS